MHLPDDGSLDRRLFLRRALAIGASAGAMSTLLLGACQPQNSSSSGGGSSKAAPKAVSCDDVSALSPADKKTRETSVKTFKYVAKTPEAAKNCANCQLYKLPGSGQYCGGCQIIKGPIHPQGYCTAWAKKLA